MYNFKKPDQHGCRILVKEFEEVDFFQFIFFAIDLNDMSVTLVHSYI